MAPSATADQEEIEQAQIVRDAPHQLVQDAREDDVGVEDRTRQAGGLAHSAGAPIASRSRDHLAARSWASVRRCSKAKPAFRFDEPTPESEGRRASADATRLAQS
jgi:hypothetical protein